MNCLFCLLYGVIKFRRTGNS